MQATDHPLIRHLGIAVVLKLMSLCALWWTFIRDTRVGVDADRAAAHLGVATDAASTHPTLSPVQRGAQP